MLLMAPKSNLSVKCKAQRSRKAKTLRKLIVFETIKAFVEKSYINGYELLFCPALLCNLASD